MFGSRMLWCSWAAALVLSTGCTAFHRTYRPAVHDHHWDPVLGVCGVCGVCGGDCEGHTPSSYTKHVLTCASGCGEIYWGEWISDPPDKVDPCDNCGNFVGPQPVGPSCLHRIAAGVHDLWGYRASNAVADPLAVEPGTVIWDETEGILVDESDPVSSSGEELIPESAESFSAPAETARSESLQPRALSPPRTARSILSLPSLRYHR